MTDEQYMNNIKWEYELMRGEFVSVGEPRAKSVYEQHKEDVKEKVEEFEVEFTEHNLQWVKETALRYLRSRLIMALNADNFKWAYNVVKQIELWSTPINYDEQKITQEDIDRIKQIPISELMPSQPISKIGDRWKYSSPFSEDKDPSFVWYVKGNTFYDYSNNLGGDNIALFMLINKCNFISTCRSLLYK